MTRDRTPTRPHFQSRGALREEALYVERPADRELPEQLLCGEFCYILAPRQIGKSSLRVRTERQLRAQGVRCATVDLTRLGSSGVTADEWYYGLVAELAERLTLRCDLGEFWEARGSTTPVHRFSLFLQDVLLTEVDGPVVIFLDEIDAVLPLPFARDDLFAAIREVYNLRPEQPAYRRLTFCLLGVAAPGDLVQDPRRTPFNIGRAIRLEDFTAEEARAFLPGLEAAGAAEPEALLDEVMAWTDGHPYMTHRLCEELARPERVAAARERAEPPARPAPPLPRPSARPPAAALARREVYLLAEELFLRRGRTEDANLLVAEQYFTRERPSYQLAQMLHLYRRLLDGELVPADGADPVQMTLRLTGMAAERRHGDKTVLRVRNRVFATVFDWAWVKRTEADQIGDTSPYIGLLLGPYRLQHVLANGSVGKVYEARDERNGQRVAIKFLHAHLAQDPDARLRFFNEALVAARVKHPGLVQVLDTGQLGSGEPYLAMELAEGESLAQRARRTGPLPAPLALRIVEQIADTLAAVHELGIVHRGLRPDNVRLVPDAEAPGGQRVKLLDFGLARVPASADAEEQAGGRTRLDTGRGTGLSLSPYTAPEQAVDASRADDRADVFALGVMLYELLSGERPFPDDRPAGWLLDRRGPRPLRELAPRVPAAVAALVEQMLDWNPARRPPMKEVAERARRALSAPTQEMPAAPTVPSGGPAPPGPVPKALELPALVSSRPGRADETPRAARKAPAGAAQERPQGATAFAEGSRPITAEVPVLRDRPATVRGGWVAVLAGAATAGVLVTGLALWNELRSGLPHGSAAPDLVASHPPRTAPDGGPAPVEDAAAQEARLRQAERALAEGKSAQAMELAKPASRASDPERRRRAWRLLGEAACQRGDEEGAENAYYRLEGPDRKALLDTCQRNNVDYAGGVFRKREGAPNQQAPLPQRPLSRQDSGRR